MKCNKCNIDLYDPTRLTQGGKGKGDLVLCGTCFNKDKKQYWLDYGRIETGSDAGGQELKTCGHKGDECFKGCIICNKEFEPKTCESDKCDKSLETEQEWKAGKCKSCQEQKPQQQNPNQKPSNSENKGIGGLGWTIIIAIILFVVGGGFWIWWENKKKSKEDEEEWL